MSFRDFKNLNRKKQFTIDDIKEDYYMSKFLLRVYFLGEAFDIEFLNEDNIQRKDINNSRNQLELLGLIVTLPYVKLGDKKREVLTSTKPYFNKIDELSPLVYRKTETLKNQGQEIIEGILEKYKSNESLLTFVSLLSEQYKVQLETIKQIKLSEENDFERVKRFPNGVIAEVKTDKFWNMAVLVHRMEKYGLLTHEKNDNDLNKKADIDNYKRMSKDTKEQRYLERVKANG